MFSSEAEAEQLRATVIAVDGEIEQLFLPSDENERLEKMKDVVGGHIEVVPVFGHRYLVSSEHAKDGLHVINRIATHLALESESIQPDDYIAGTVMLVSQRAVI